MPLEYDRDWLREDLEESLRDVAAEAEQAEQPAELEDLGARLIPSLAVVTAPEAVVNDDSPTRPATTTSAEAVTTMTSVVGGTAMPTRARRRRGGRPIGGS